MFGRCSTSLNQAVVSCSSPGKKMVRNISENGRPIFSKETRLERAVSVMLKDRLSAFRPGQLIPTGLFNPVS